MRNSPVLSSNAGDEISSNGTIASRMVEAIPSWLLAGAALIALATSFSCGGGGGGGGANSNTLYADPSDPRIITAATDSGTVEYLGEKDASGVPLRLTALQVAGPDGQVVIQLDEAQRPVSLTSPDGVVFAVEWTSATTAAITATGTDGTQETTTVDLASASASSASRSATAASVSSRLNSLAARASASPAVEAAGISPMAVNINVTACDEPLDQATAWIVSQRQGAAAVFDGESMRTDAARVAPGRFSASIQPLGAMARDEFTDACDGLIDTYCTAIKFGLKKLMVDDGGCLVFIELGPEMVAACQAAFRATNAGCKTVDVVPPDQGFCDDAGRVVGHLFDDEYSVDVFAKSSLSEETKRRGTITVTGGSTKPVEIAFEFDDPENCALCGDGTCDPDEDVTTCPDDCAACGDGVCSATENSATCSADCTSRCGDEVCDGGETTLTCQADCGVCRNGTCDPGENETNCRADCGFCGDGVCFDLEDESTCPSDCAPDGFCGDGICQDSERNGTFICLNDCTPQPNCGDGVCDSASNETQQSCPTDCSSCVHLSGPTTENVLLLGNGGAVVPDIQLTWVFTNSCAGSADIQYWHPGMTVGRYDSRADALGMHLELGMSRENDQWACYQEADQCTAIAFEIVRVNSP